MPGIKQDRTGIPFSKLQDFQERISYDPNGNILRYKRNGNNSFASAPLGMDSLRYSYVAGTNRLDHINDSVPAGNYAVDVDDQPAGNYKYDSMGNMVTDSAEGISHISWTVYGKIRSMTRTDGSVISYRYDAGGHRISKTFTAGLNTTVTCYVRDAQGNIMSVYTAGVDSVNSGDLTQSELHLYGSSRLGMMRSHRNVQVRHPSKDITLPLLGTGNGVTFIRGNKLFELTNHLGNVLATVSDKKLGHSADDSTVDRFQPEVVSAQDYYPFGMLEVGRSEGKGKEYRFGFNGKEMDNEVKGIGNQYDYGMRGYDARIARFLSIDPLFKQYPALTPYQFANNNPVANTDLDGGESKYFNITIYETYNGQGKVRQTYSVVEDKSREAGWFVHGGLYRSSGKLGDGQLYTVTRMRTTISADRGDDRQHIEIQNIGGIYVPPPPKFSSSESTSSMPFQIVVFGSGVNPEDAPASKPNPKTKTITFNHKEFQEIMEPVLLGVDAKSPTEIEPSEALELIEHIGEYGLEKAIEKLDEKWEGQHANESKPNNTTNNVNLQKSRIKTGVVYYDESLRANIKRTSDSTGDLTDERATDTINKK